MTPLQAGPHCARDALSGAGHARRVLLVEDSPADARLVRDALTGNGTALSVEIATSVEEALYHLRAGAAEARLPDLVLLDLHLRDACGFEVLAELKRDERLRCIPVVVLSSSLSREDVARSYELWANGYVAKPVDLDAFTDAVQVIRSFWLVTAQLPPAAA
jgi:two-component system response regulator